MNYKRKKLLFLAMLLVLTLLPFYPAGAQADTIFEKSGTTTVTSGVTRQNIVRFTDDGWLNINVLRVDLSNKYVKVDAITNGESLKKLASVKTLAESGGAVAAVNASFFNPTGNGNGYADGPIVQSGKILTAMPDFNAYGDVMGSFSIDKLNNLIYSYVKTAITLKAPGGAIAAAQYNKPTRNDFNDPIILDRKWSLTSPGASEAYPDLVEMTVADGKVLEIRKAQPPVDIPENGFVVCAREAGAAFLENSFKPGDKAEFSISTTPDWNNLQMSVTGASILMADGRIPDAFSYDVPYIAKEQPRTMVGSTKDGKQLLLVTVDGRQNSSIGLTQADSAQLMKDLGAYNALNMDGGGSTTMVERPLGNTGLEVVNSPSDGMNRPVAAAIGVFSTAPSSSLAGMVIDTEDTNIFVNTTRAFTVRGYDKYFNPVAVDPSQVKWSLSGLMGRFEGNVLRPWSVGDGKVTATAGGVTASVDISSLSTPVRLSLSSRLLKLYPGDTASISVSGFNKNGYAAKINPADVKWSVSSNIGSFDGAVFKPAGSGTGYIDASIGDTHAYSGVSVATASSSVKETFEAGNGSFLAYPADVKGSYAISKAQKHGGSSSGELKYEFSGTEDTQASYLVFANNGIPVDASTTKIGVWVYNTHVNSNWLRAEVYDTAGKKYLVTLSKNMDWTGWKYLEAPLEGISSPSRITRLYIAKVHPVADSGSIYFDDLTMIANGHPGVDKNLLPQDTVPVDENYSTAPYQSSSNSFRFAVFGQTRQPSNLLEKLFLNGIAAKTNNFLEAAAFVGAGARSTAPQVVKPALTTGSGYKSMDIKTSRFLQLDMSNQGLRQSDKAQWHWLQQQLDSFKGDNLFLFLSGAPDTFSDGLEASLFKDTLTSYRQKTGKNVWVFYKGAKNESNMYRGVKYISAAGFDIDGLTPDKSADVKYVLVTVKGNNVTFEIKPIF